MNQIEAETGDGQLGEIVDEVLGKMSRGEAIDVEQYAREHPDVAEVLRHALPALRAVSQSSFGGNADATTHGSQPNHDGEPFEANRTIGDFRIIRELGRGGMGVVYEADELSLGRKVALKILPFAGIVDERALQRFRNEVRAAAGLDHPNIVSVHSAGEQRGVHYYAMQFVRGQTLAEVIHQLSQMKDGDVALSGDSISQILSVPSDSPAPSGTEPTAALARPAESLPAEDTVPVEQHRQQTIVASSSGPDPHFYRSIAILGVQAAGALQHAHDNGVLHRDIKPGNLMLDAQSQLYITDFGLARIETDAAMTMTGDLIGTLRYMSPEQALAKRVVIDQRCDIYSLGATLYELLALRPVFSGSDRQALLKQIAFEDPVKLRKIDRAIPADLETIIHKSLAKNPDERYTTAEEFASDLQAFIDHRPITARPPTPLQRLGKWSRRNRGLVAAGAVAAAICLVLLVVSNIMIAGQKALAERAADSERVQRQNAESERDAAQRARDQAEDVTQFLVEAFRSPDPDKDGRTVTVVEVLDRAVDDIDSREELGPQRKADLLNAIGGTYLGLELGRQAVPLFEQVRVLRQDQLGERHAKTLDAMHDLAWAYRLAGRHREAVDLLERTLQLKREELGERHSSTLVSMNDLAICYHHVGNYTAEVKLNEKTLKIRREELGERHRATLVSMSNLANSYLTVGRYSESIDLHEQTLELKREEFGDRHPKTLTEIGSLASAYSSAGRDPEAIKLEEQTLKLKREVMGEQHPGTLTTMNNLAHSYASVGRHREASELHDQVYKLRREILGEHHPATLHSMHAVAIAYLTAGRNQDAIELQERTLKLRRDVLGERHPDTLNTMSHLGNALIAAGRYSEAATLLEQTVKLMRETRGERNVFTLSSTNLLARAYASLARYPEAIERFEQVLKLQREELGDLHPQTLIAMGDLAKAYTMARRDPEAIKLYEQNLNLKREKLGDRHPQTLTTMGNLAVSLGRVGRYREAVELNEQTLKLKREVLGDRHPGTLSTMSDLASDYERTERYDEATQLCEQTLKLRREVLGPRHPDTFVSMANLASSFLGASRHAKAIELYEQTLELERGEFGERHPSTLATMNNLASAYGRVGRVEEAAELLKRTLELTRELLGPLHPNTLSFMKNLAEAYQDNGRFAEAIELQEETLKLRREVLGPWHPHTLSSILGHAGAYRDAGRYAEANKLYDEAIEFLQNPPEEIQQDADRIARTYASVLTGAALNNLELKQSEKAEAQAREALQLRERLIPEHWLRFAAQSYVGRALLQQAKVDEAEQQLLDGFAGMHSQMDTIPAVGLVHLLDACQSLIDLYKDQGNAEQASKWEQTLENLSERETIEADNKASEKQETSSKSL